MEGGRCGALLNHGPRHVTGADFSRPCGAGYVDPPGAARQRPAASVLTLDDANGRDGTSLVPVRRLNRVDVPRLYLAGVSEGNATVANRPRLKIDLTDVRRR